MVQIGTKINVAGRQPLMAVRSLGIGGEGEVFELVEQGGGPRLALKWFHPERSNRERRSHIGELVRLGAPAENFLWPQGIVEDSGSGRFGYVMDLRPPEYSGLAALLRGEVERSESAVVRFAFELAKAFMALHTRGLCYRDINFGNAFMNLGTGEALICDNDNVGIDGVSRAMMLGSRKFMAPEIVRKEAMPSVYTDRYSLAVMLFYLLIVHHPLEGALTDSGLADAEADLRHYGYEPVFCFDPDNPANRPDLAIHPHVQGLWDTYPQQIRDLFTRSFTVGLQQTRRRVVDSEWCHALADLASGFLKCETCGRPLYVESGKLPETCQQCGQRPKPVTALLLNGYTIPTARGTRIASHYFGGDLDLAEVVLSVVAHPTDPHVLGLRNETSEPMVYTSDGADRLLPPGRSGRLTAGVSFRARDNQVEVVTLEAAP